MSKHTQGPWTFTKYGGSFVITAEGASLMGSETYYPWVPEKEADWRLITASPELLEALQELLDCQSTAPDSVVSRARAAIAKATGEA